MNRILSLAAVALVTAAPISAQTDEDKFNEKQAARLHTFAKSAFKKGFPRQARLIWLQLLKLYSRDHAGAHAALGEVRLGKSWGPREGFVYPLTDTGSGATGKALFKQYESLKKALAGAHRTQASAWQKAGRKDKSDYHFKMVLRWVKGDAKAQAALKHKAVGAVTGTDLEQILYDRSKRIEKAVVEQTKIKYPVEVLADSKQVFLDQAGVTYKTYRSEHFILRGDLEEPMMKEALEWAERALRVVAVAFPKDGGFNSDVKRWLRDWAYFVDKKTYQQILKANAALVQDLPWKLEHTTTSGLFSDQAALKIGATGSRQVLFDACVRNVARSYSGFGSAGLVEGIGHTFVGMMFNNNRLFSVDLKKQQEGTRASEEDREYHSPNFDIWKDLALEQAWRITGGVKASMLPLVKAATFTNEQRIKAWSFCDYVMRRDPKLLRDMDRLRDKKNPWDIEELFAKGHEVTIPQLDKEWEDFWTGASPVMKAIKNNTPPLEAISKDVTAWLKAFNIVRKQTQATPVTWSSNYSARCKEHADYLKNNKKERGPGQVQQQDPMLPGGSHLGNMFAQMALVSTKAKVATGKKMFKKWLDIPGYRDAFVNNSILSIGIYSDRSILVVNVVSGMGTPDKKHRGYRCYPLQHQKGVPPRVAVKDLGPELMALLEKNGHGKLKTLGYPLTLHFGSGVGGDRSTYRCSVTDRDGSVPGLVMMDNGRNRHTTAPGMVTFYPLRPLANGNISVMWTWQFDGARKLNYQFQTK